MSRSYESSNLIQLPRLTAEETLALVRALITEAKTAGGLSPDMLEALHELEGMGDVLAEQLLRRQRLLDDGIDPVEARAADMTLDNLWGALRDLLNAWARLGAEREAEHARLVLARVFPDGLSFLNKPYKAEWADSETRLTLIDREGIAADIETLGGGPFLRLLRAAHQNYGEVLHITTARPLPSEGADVRGALADTQGALRQYLVQVVASRRPKNPATIALADRLAGPVTRWATSGRGAKKPEPVEQGPEGEDASAGD
ncbi:MAG: hypothetical protein MUF34_30965 [Polyangiaceae bacterium]|jgi:hypothetical protein|nr:hypothetical protein [Polyangiaceae bacterium]